MKRILLILLCVVFLLSFCGCRRRITPDADEILYETYPENVPDPNLWGDETMADGTPDANADPNRVFDFTAPPVDEEIAAQGGEIVDNAPEPQETGDEIMVTFDPNGGECSLGSVTVHIGAAYGELPTPIRPGHEWKGWFTDPENGFSVDATTVVTIQEDHTLYAQWSEFMGYTITFDPNGGRISPYQAEKRVYPGETYGELPTAYHSGYIQLGWFTQPEGGEMVTANTPFTANEEQTLYAQWEYSPLDYWAWVLENTTQKIFSCQETFLYLELEAQGVTMQHCQLIDSTGSQNVAKNREDPHVDDNWVKEKNPGVILKITENMGAAQAVRTNMETRFPGKRIYVFPSAAVDGTDGEKLYYAIALAKQLYPEYFYEIDLNTVAAELAVQGSIWG